MGGSPASYAAGHTVDYTIDDILSRLNVEAFFTSEGFKPIKTGRKRLEGACPFCGDPKHFNLDPKKGLWICNKCGEKGNAITYYAKLHGCQNGEAVQAIKRYVGLEDTPPFKSGKFRSAAPPPSPPPPTDAEAPPPGPGDKPAFIWPEYTKVYNRLVELAPLEPEDRAALQAKRGFNSQTINRLKFRSGGRYMAAVVEQLGKEFSTDLLLESGVLVKAKDTGHVQPNSQLLDKRILIPYLDAAGYVYHLRPHKLGFADKSVHPYCLALLAGGNAETESIVLTEGEFKAAALAQWGFAALAIPGISSFGNKHFDRLVNVLREHGVKRVTIVFDNEEKGNPEYKDRYKPKVEDRYDTPYWAYIMASQLGVAGFSARIGWLPDAWRIDGKADWDSALAQGRTRQDVERVLTTALPPKEFLDALPEEARKVVRRKTARYYARNRLKVRREFGRYVITRTRGDSEWEDIISNFVINIKSSFATPDGVIRNVEFVNEYGERSNVFPLDPAAMAGTNEFKKFCFSKGNYVFDGTAADLSEIWKLEFLRDRGEFIWMPERIGRITEDLWLFGNLAVKQGIIYEPDNDGIIWIDGKGYKPQSFQVGPRGEQVEDAIPSLHTKDLDIREVAEKLRDSIGGYEAYLALGWVAMTVFSWDVFKAFKCLPILFAHGMRGGGKSTLARWLMNFFGVETEGTGLADTTQNYIVRALSYYSSLGVWLDEYRNEPKITQKDGYLRSAYNRQLSGKGTTTAYQARSFAVHATLCLTGEELPQDSGLFTRLVQVQISAYRHDREMYDWLNANCIRFSRFTLDLIQHYGDYRDKLIAGAKELKAALIARGITDRIAENYAICAAAFETTILEDAEFIQWVFRQCEQIKYVGESEHMLNQFWQDVDYLVSEGDLGAKHLAVDLREQKLYLWLNGVYEVWAIHYRKKTGKDPFDKPTILKYLSDEPYFVEAAKAKKLGGSARRTVVIDLERAKGAENEAIMGIAEYLSMPRMD